jgi:GNAT superfamily N-acetyltransferase
MTDGEFDESARQLGVDDLPRVRQLFEACAEFFARIHGDAMQEAEQILHDVPPGKTPEDKLVFGVPGVGSQDRLDGLVELLRGYPGPDDWCIGLLLVAPDRRSCGLGAATVSALARYVQRAGGRALHLVVHEQNPSALRFWLRHGFSIQDRVIQTAAHGTNHVYKLTRALSP